ncbi:MAG: fumarate hydratase [Gammaproteobacteria bacterium]|nr:fumarate hydratase [Gammaproteobacteria bacterium]
MSKTYRLTLPFTEESVRSLSTGDMVYLDGEVVITAGLPTHQRIVDQLDRGEPMPMDLNGAALLHFGGYSREVSGKTEVVYMNPTTSTRFNPYMPRIIEAFGLRVVGGKGGLDAATTRVMKDIGCVYLSFPGGVCTLYSQAIREVMEVGWRDLLLHYRLVKLRVAGLGPGTVAIDAHGNSLYDQLQAEAARRMTGIMRELGGEHGKGSAKS